MFWNRARDAKTTADADAARAPRRAFRPAADRLESREVLNASVFGNASLALPTMAGIALRTTPAFANTFAATPSINTGVFLGGTTNSSLLGPSFTSNLRNIGAVNFGNQGFVGNTGNLLSSFIHLPSRVNLSAILANQRTGLLSGLGGAVNAGLTSGFGVQSGLAFNGGLGGTGFGLGSNVGFNNALFGSGLGAMTGLAFNNGLGGFGTGSFLSSSGLAFNNGLGGTGFGSASGLGAMTGLAFNNGLGGTGFTSTNGLAANNGLAFTGGLGFNNRFNNPFNSLGSTFLGVGNNLNTPLTNLNTFNSGLGGLNGAGSSAGLFIPAVGTGFTSGLMTVM